MDLIDKFQHGKDEAAAKEYLLSIGIDDEKLQEGSPILIPAMYIIAANKEYKERNNRLDR